MYFTEYDTNDGRTLVPVDGRGLFVTDSSTVEFIGANQRERFPLISSADEDLLGPGLANVIPLEMKGFIAIVPTARYNWHQAAGYETFNFSPNDCKVVRFADTGVVVNFAQLVDTEGEGEQFVQKYSMSWVDDLRGVGPVFLYYACAPGSPDLGKSMRGKNVKQLKRELFKPYNPYNVG